MAESWVGQHQGRCERQRREIARVLEYYAVESSSLLAGNKFQVMGRVQRGDQAMQHLNGRSLRRLKGDGTGPWLPKYAKPSRASAMWGRFRADPTSTNLQGLFLFLPPTPSERTSTLDSVNATQLQVSSTQNPRPIETKQPEVDRGK